MTLQRDNIKSINLTDFEFSLIDNSEPIIKVIGVGGGAGNAISYMYSHNIENVSFIVCNTDAQALHNSPIPTKLLIGDGLSAADTPEVAQKAAEESEREIENHFNDSTKMVLITVGMGGGTGTGAAPVVARIAREKGMLTIGIVTIPFLFEGHNRILKALAGAEEMRKHVDALILINNESLADIYKDITFINAFGKADETIATIVRSISEILTNAGTINLEFNDVNTILKDSGVAIISSGYGEGENRITKAIQDALNSPLLNNRSIEGSKRVLFNIYYSAKSKTPLVMKEVNQLTDFMTKFAPEVNIIWGVAYDDTLNNKIKITILAAGFEQEQEQSELTTKKPV